MKTLITGSNGMASVCPLVVEGFAIGSAGRPMRQWHGR
jgi:hypothetical protein